MVSIRLQGVSKRFGNDPPIIESLNLEVRPAECLVLLGPSGCGKSTTLRMIAGLEAPSAGSIEIDAKPAEHLTPRQRNVAMVFQASALYPHLTVRKNLAFTLKAHGVAPDDAAARLAQTAESLGITDLLERKPATLSGGQLQRVAIGRALALKPAIWLLDEPFSQLDARLRVSMRTELRALIQQTGITTIHVTHDQEEAMALADRIAVMRAGRIEQIAEPVGLYSAPANRWIAGFIGSPEMNFLEGMIVAGKRWTAAANTQWVVPLATRSELAPGSSAVLGVRPQAVSLSTPVDTDPVGSAVSAIVRTVEVLGDHADITLLCAHGGSTLRARVPARDRPQPGDRVAVSFEPSGMLLFEPGPYGRLLGEG